MSNMATGQRRKILAKALLAELGLFIWAGTTLFGLAGTMFWLDAWIFLCLSFAFLAGLAIYLYWHDPELLAERLTIIHADQFLWDRVWALGFYTCSSAWFIFMPIDVGWHLSYPPMHPIWEQSAGVLLLLCSFVVIFYVMRENHYASPVVRIQSGHTVVETGLYRFVRHPLYCGAMLFFWGTPLLLQSGYGLAFSVSLFFGLLWLRARHEEETLSQFLPGYQEYMKQVRWRFIPGIY